MLNIINYVQLVTLYSESCAAGASRAGGDDRLFTEGGRK